MFLIVQLDAYACFSFGNFGHGLMGDLEEGRALSLVLFPHLKLGVNLQS